MDPLEAAGRVVGYLVPYALDKAAELATKIGKDAVDRIGGWLDGLRARWAGDAEASAVLADFETAPQEGAGRLQEVLADRMEKDAGLAESAVQLAAQVGPTVVVVMRGGEVDFQEGAELGDVRRGHVHLEQTLTRGTRMTGPKLGDIG